MRIHAVVLALTMVSTALAVLEFSFEQWEAKFAKKFDATRRNFFRQNFIANKFDVVTHNLKSRSYLKGLNEYSHLPPRDFIATRCKTVLPKTLSIEAVVDLAPLAAAAVESGEEIPVGEATTTTMPPPPPQVGSTITTAPSNFPFFGFTAVSDVPAVDWRGLMQPIQNQGSCGACWAFAATSALEAMLRVRNRTVPDYTLLAPQYLIDCDAGQSGCEGGWPATALRYVRGTASGNAAPMSHDYPYLTQRMACNRLAPRQKLNIARITEKFIGGNETALMLQVANFGPTIVAMYATNDLVTYKSGVYRDAACPAGGDQCGSVNHAVVVVGFGTDPALGDFWLVRNSWGTTWGEDGYFRIARNRNNMCNMACWAINVW